MHFFVLPNYVARFVHHTNHPIPQPMMLLDSSQKYNTNYNETIAMQNIQPQYSRSHSHPAPSHFDAHDGTYNPSLQRPYSFADGQVANLTEIHGEIKKRYKIVMIHLHTLRK